MKKIKVITFLSALLWLGSCSDKLDTVPTNMTSEGVVFSDVAGAKAAINGMYRFMYTIGYTSGYESENFGYSSVMLAHDMMGDDMAQRNPGSQWFFYDHLFWTRTEINNKADRPYGWWTFFYSLISRANGIIANIDGVEGSDADKNNIKGQALALRAFSYYNLINIYQLTCFGNENLPGVPLYTEPTDKNSVGKARGKVSDVYKQINDDLRDAVIAFKNGSERTHKSNININVVYGFQARVAMMQHRYEDAIVAATNALGGEAKDAFRLMNASELTSGFNSIANPEWMWGAEVLDAQSTSTYSFMSHLDAAEAGGYAKNAAVMMSKWMYDKIPAGDRRKQWALAPTVNRDTISAKFLAYYETASKSVAVKLWEEDQNALYVEKEGKQGIAYSNNSYLQQKFRMRGQGNWANDLVYMRAAEMYLIIAEANCLLGQYTPARDALVTLVSERQPGYSAAGFAGSTTVTFESNNASDEEFAARNLLDEIYFQRRLELWGEGFRCFDIDRLKSLMKRDYDENNFYDVLYKDKNTKLYISHPYCSFEFAYDDSKLEYIMKIPMTEFNSNPNMDVKTDQNPDPAYY